ncbi:DUF3560 domain-containing protein [Nocardioides sp. Bht2]|uniref:DUF3560 domain-containing protein n=1 Tax=Nocardioides sp. Bht2 TaxID=3392297 RepID=UPI0039B50A0F
MSTIQVEHGQSGTTVTGTQRGDRETTTALKRLGFRWSRNLDAWYLPRTWTEPTRLMRVRQLMSEVDAELTTSTEAPRTAAEKDQGKRDRAAARAERLDARAEREKGTAAAAARSSRQILDQIPMGQPILVGHHSQPRHERAVKKLHSNLGREVAANAAAQDATERADRARRVASGAESVVTIGNRIERNDADLRRIDRRLASLSDSAQSAYADRLNARRLELVDQIDYDRQKLSDRGGDRYSRETVKPGDFVQVTGIWFPVLRSNAKSVSVPSPMAAADSTWTNTAQWHKVQAHLPRNQATAEKVRSFASKVQRPFAGLAARLNAEADKIASQQQ